MATTATPAKLKDGSWGARTAATVAVGDVVTITTRGGKSWDARVTRVLWAGEDAAICVTESLDRTPRARGTRTGCSCGSVEEYERAGDCWTCQHDR